MPDEKDRHSWFETELGELKSTVANLTKTSEILVTAVSDLRTSVATLMASSGKTDIRSAIFMFIGIWWSYSDCCCKGLLGYGNYWPNNR